MNEALKGLHQHCEGSMFDRCGECPYHESDFNNPCAGIDCRDRLIIDLKKEIEERTNEAAAYAELLIKYGYEFT